MSWPFLGKHVYYRLRSSSLTYPSGHIQEWFMQALLVSRIVCHIGWHTLDQYLCSFTDAL